MAEPAMRYFTKAIPFYITQWLILFILFCSVGCLFWYLVNWLVLNTLANPLIVTMESTTYPIGDIDFPAVSLCNINRISNKGLMEKAKKLHEFGPDFRNRSFEDTREFFLQAGRLLDFSYDKWSKWNKLLEAIPKKIYENTDIVQEMQKLAPDCNEILLRCSWAGDVVPCESLFTVRRTGRGHCCVFNYVLDYDSAASPNATIAEPKRQQLPGYTRGLTVILDPLLDDYAYPVSNFKGFDVLLHEPTHFADLSAGLLVHRRAEPEQAEFLELRSIKQLASPEVRKYPLSIRKCLFKDELSTSFNGMYSYSACIVRCRIRAIQSLCKCTPYFLPAGKTEGPYCTLNDLKCLEKYKEKLLYLYPIDPEKKEGLEVEMEDSLFCPDCLPDCELTQHFTRSVKSPLRKLGQKAYFVYNIIKDINMTNKCLLSVYHAISDGSFDRLDVVAYWFEVLSNIGGYGGVILGLSFFNFVEIIYFLCVRFIIILRFNYIKYH